MLRRTTLILLGILSIFLGASTAPTVAETPTAPLQILVKMRVIELPGEAGGKERVLSEPTIITLLGRPCAFDAGGEAPIPDQLGIKREFLSFGTIAEVKPHAIRGEKLRADVSIQATRIAKTGDDDLVSAIGPTLQASGLFEFNKTYRLQKMSVSDQMIVFEVTFEEMKR